MSFELIAWIIVTLIVLGIILMFLGDRYGENGSGCGECGKRPAFAFQVGQTFIVLAGLIVLISGTYTITAY